VSPATTSTQIAHAVQRLVDGHLVAFPTETVYGLGADALNPQALARIYAAKGRPADHPVIVHLAPNADLNFWAQAIPPEAARLIDAFWPGPLTLIFPRTPQVPLALTGGQDSVGLRCPAHPVAQQLLTAFAATQTGGHGGIAAPSANRFGHVSPTRAAHVRSEFAGLDDPPLLILEGGAAQVGIESTILDVSRLAHGIPPVLLRPGHILADQLAEVMGRAVHQPDYAAPRVSGSLKAHYAPHTPLSILPETALHTLPPRAMETSAVLLTFQPVPDLPQGYDPRLVPNDPVQYAHDLYALLRALDQGQYAHIFVQAPPAHRRWQAVNDRLSRAAAAFAENS